MRKFLSDALFFLAFVVGFVSAGAWAYMIWGADWGTSYRSRGLWFMALGVGSPIVFLIGLFAVLALQTWLFPETDRR